MNSQRKTGILIFVGAVLLGTGLIVAGFGTLVLARSSRQDRRVRIQRPPPAPQEQQSASLTVEIDEDGRVFVKGKEYPLDELADVIRKEDPKDGFLEIRASKEASWAQVSPVVRAGVDAGISKLNITALTDRFARPEGSERE